MPETPAAQVLIVEDEPEHADVMADALRKPGHISTVVNSVGKAVDELTHGAFDVIVTDLRMPTSGGADGVAPDGSDAGLAVLRAARRLHPQAETIMVTAHGDVATARAAFKEGAYDFIEKPLDLEVFRSLVNRAAETVLLRHDAGGMDGLVQHEGFEGIVAGSEPMRRILRTVKTVAGSTLPVLITGESGTGKELIARAIHTNSPRAKGRFVALNCAAETENLLEDQLFGHVRGAFTGADKDREGVFEYATGGPGGVGGTLFLDEIGDMPLKMQAKLLRVLETGEVVRVGSNEPRRTDVRLVSATNKDMRALIAAGTFRQDLYFRIQGAHVHLPPLRERREDIPRIVRHAIARGSAGGPALGGPPLRGGSSDPGIRGGAAGHPVPDITDAAMMRLTAYPWPGNVRQLLNVVQNMLVMAGAEDRAPGQPLVLDARHIPDDIRSADDSEPPAEAGGASLAGASLQQLEKRAIRETLRLTAGNREQAATMLGIGERTLYRKLKEYGLR
ncbi:MAG: sigma-54-dependent Fis family transcriptional regulator [Phycisphaerales bacterium]|nr:sigma-54-dependent Fis family transcriptional regulator [Phycisphaerales bacterium]